MPAVPAWTYPSQFDLTNPYNGTLSFNVQTASGIYLLIQDGCDFSLTVRSTKDDVPQADGSILHTRFMTGAEMTLTVQLWESLNEIACSGDLLVEMLDELSGALRSLLNAGDNEGRLAWDVAGGNTRMLDDVRLLAYPVFAPGPPPTVTWTLDSEFPYAQDLTQICTVVADGDTETISSNGTAAYDPVYLVNVPSCSLPYTGDAAAVHDFTITVESDFGTQQFVYDDSLPGADPISAGGHYAEINTFRNTIVEDGDGANLKAGVDELNSEYPQFFPGDNDVTIEGCDMVVLHQAAWG